jgi:hypothetical protein
MTVASRFQGLRGFTTLLLVQVGAGWYDLVRVGTGWCSMRNSRFGPNPTLPINVPLCRKSFWQNEDECVQCDI